MVHFFSCFHVIVGLDKEQIVVFRHPDGKTFTPIHYCARLTSSIYKLKGTVIMTGLRLVGAKSTIILPIADYIGYDF